MQNGSTPYVSGVVNGDTDEDWYKIEFRNDSGGNVHSVVGKVSFDKTKLSDNINAMINAVRKLKPQTSKGHFFKKVVIKATMTPAVQLNVQ